MLKCPLCGKIHSATEWHNTAQKRWKTIRKLPSNKQNCWFECPSCGETSKGIELVPVVSVGGQVTGEGWFAYYHTPSEKEEVTDVATQSEVPAMSET
jgi:predicted RNA-binding Zn-ribbon protein involved in translation (DUF1610 family)